METEQLRVMMDTLAQMGDAGKTAFIWWLVLRTFISVGVTLVICFTVFNVVRLLTRMSECVGFMKEAREQLRTGSAGELTPRELNDTISSLRSLMRKRDQ